MIREVRKYNDLLNRNNLVQQLKKRKYSRSHWNWVKYDHSVQYLESCLRVQKLRKLPEDRPSVGSLVVVGHLHLLAELQHLHLGLGELGLGLHQRLGRSKLYLAWHSSSRNLTVGVHLRSGEIDLNRQHHRDS